jgi:hypothetical protein
MVDFSQSRQQPPSYLPFSAQPGGVAPQGFDFGKLLENIAGQAAQALPGIIMGLLSADPTIGPQVRAQGVAPQSLVNFGFQTPIGGGGISMFDAAPSAGVTPQGFDFGGLLKTVAGHAAQMLPGLIMGLLSADPVIGPQLRAQGVAPQSLINIGLLGAGPSAGVAPQGFDFGSLLKKAVQVLPGVVMALLAADPVVGPQLKAQGVAPQSLFNIGVQTPFFGGGLSMFDAPPSPGVTPQGFDFGKLARQLAEEAAKAIPGIITSLLSATPMTQHASSSSTIH